VILNVGVVFLAAVCQGQKLTAWETMAILIKCGAAVLKSNLARRHA